MLLVRALDYFALLAVVLIPAGGFAAYALFDPAGAGQPGGNGALRVAIYLALAFSTLDLAVGHAVIVSKHGDGKAPAWLVSFAYSKIAQTLAYYCVLALVALRVGGVTVPGAERLLYATLGAMAVASVLAACVFTALWLAVEDGFRYRIRPWPWQLVRDYYVARATKEEG